MENSLELVFLLQEFFLLPSLLSNKSIFFYRSTTGLHPEFSFSETGCHMKVKELSTPYYLLERFVGFRLLPIVLSPCEMQIFSVFEFGSPALFFFNISRCNTGASLCIPRRLFWRALTFQSLSISVCANTAPTQGSWVLFWTNLESSTIQNSSCTVTYLPSHKQTK